jgi:hypothetical protein
MIYEEWGNRISEGKPPKGEGAVDPLNSAESKIAINLLRDSVKSLQRSDHVRVFQSFRL